MSIITSEIESDKTVNYIPPEISILIYFLKKKAHLKHKEEIEYLLKEKVDYKYLIEISRKHKVLPLLYSGLINLNCNVIDVNYIKQLKKILQYNTQKNFQLTLELLDILKYLQINQIEAIPLKGVILANLAYGNLGLRSVSDLDIIVRKKDFVKTQQLLIDRGYKASSINKEDYYQQAQYYKQKNITIGIDLHYEFAPKRHFATVDSNLFWANVKSSKIANQDIKIFALEYTLIHLCLEGIKEHWRCLNRVCDVSELICNRQIDWKLLLANAEKVNKKEAVFLGLYLAHTILDTSIPNFVLQEINSLFTYQMPQDKIYNFLFRQEFNLLGAIKWYLFISQAFSSYRLKTEYLYRVIKEKLVSTR